MEGANIHLVLHHECTDHDTLSILASRLDPVWCSCIVDLRVDVPDYQGPVHTALQLAAAVNQVLEVCFCLQHFVLWAEETDLKTMVKPKLSWVMVTELSSKISS